MKGFFESLGFFASRFNQAIVITIELSIISLVAATIIGIIVGLVIIMAKLTNNSDLA